MPTQRPATITLRTSLLEDATAIVEQEYAEELSLDEIARRVASSRRQLQRAYAEIGQTTFRDHVTSVRMRRAAEMLAQDGLTVREVANRVGYRQPAQFAKAFRRHQGLAPSEWRLDHARRTSGEASADGRPAVRITLNEPQDVARAAPRSGERFERADQTRADTLARAHAA